jgi:hypothetical protein
MEKTVKTLSSYASKNLFEGEKIELLSDYTSNKSLFDSLFNSPLIKRIILLNSLVFLPKAEFENLLNSLYRYSSSFFSVLSLSNTTVSSTNSHKNSHS